MLDVLTSIPGVKQVTEAVVRITFFDQVLTFSIWLLSSIHSRRLVRRRRYCFTDTPAVEEPSFG